MVQEVKADANIHILECYVFKVLPRRLLSVEALKISGHPSRLTRKVVRAREGGRREGKQDGNCRRCSPYWLRCLKLAQAYLRLSSVGTREGTVADLRARRARDGGQELQPCKRSVQRERNGKLSWRERERGGAAWESHGEDSMCMLIGRRMGWWESHGEDDSMCMLIGQRVGWWARVDAGF